MRPGGQDGVNDNRGSVRSPEYRRGVCGSEGGRNEDPGLYPKNHGKRLKCFFFFFFFKGSDMFLLYMLKKSLKLQDRGWIRGSRVEATSPEKPAICTPVPGLWGAHIPRGYYFTFFLPGGWEIRGSDAL